MEILNSEGTIMSVERIHNDLFLKIKMQDDNRYAYFPINRNLLQRYFAGEINTREMLIPLESFSFINDRYTNIENGLYANSIEEILKNI